MMAAPTRREMSFHKRHNGSQVNGTNEKQHLQEAMS